MKEEPHLMVIKPRVIRTSRNVYFHCWGSLVTPFCVQILCHPSDLNLNAAMQSLGKLPGCRNLTRTSNFTNLMETCFSIGNAWC